MNEDEIIFNIIDRCEYDKIDELHTTITINDEGILIMFTHKQFEEIVQKWNNWREKMKKIEKTNNKIVFEENIEKKNECIGQCICNDIYVTYLSSSPTLDISIDEGYFGIPAYNFPFSNAKKLRITMEILND